MSLEPRVARIEAHIKHIDTEMWSNFKWLLSIFITGFGTLVGLMTHGFHWL